MIRATRAMFGSCANASAQFDKPAKAVVERPTQSLSRPFVRLAPLLTDAERNEQSRHHATISTMHEDSFRSFQSFRWLLKPLMACTLSLDLAEMLGEDSHCAVGMASTAPALRNGATANVAQRTTTLGFEKVNEAFSTAGREIVPATVGVQALVSVCKEGQSLRIIYTRR